jgi:hypothetical protein
MTVTVRVLAQYFENYGFADGNVGENAYWKPKGRHEFILEDVNSDLVMYAYDLQAVLKRLVESQSDDLNRFEYREHEVIFHEPTKLNANELEEAIRTQHSKLEMKHGLD